MSRGLIIRASERPNKGRTRRRLDVVVLGEALIDFVSMESGVDLINAMTFRKAAGGAPANVAVGLARLGMKVGFIGKVGDEAFGRFLAETLRGEGVDISQMRFDRHARTALAFVSLRQNGEREFAFFRQRSADTLLRVDEIDPNFVTAARILHFGSISLIADPIRAATFAALEWAREAGLVISFDPNLRLALWPDASAATQGIMTGWRYADIVKISEDEAEFLTGKRDPKEAANLLWEPRLRCLTITQGPRGSFYRTRTSSGHVPSFPVNAIDTTGAGDGFVAGLLAKLLEADFRDSNEIMQDAQRFANAVAALTTRERGAIPALPSRRQVDEFLRAQPV